MHRLWPLLLTAALATSGLSVAGPVRAAELTYPEARILLRERNEALKAAGEEVDRRQDERAAARGLYFPKVEANARYTRINAPLSMGLDLDLDGIRQVILGLHPTVPPEAIPAFEKRIDYEFQDEGFWRADVNFTWPIFTGGRIRAANRAAGAQLESAREQRRRTDQNLQTELARRYFGVCLAQQAFLVRQQVLEGLNRHVFEARRLEEEGLIPRVERLHAEVAQAGAARETGNARRDLEVARTALAGLLSAAGEVTPLSPLFLQTEVDSLETYLALADEANADLAYLATQHDLARQAFSAQRGSWFPEIYLYGVRELYTRDLTLLDPEWALGVGARFTLFDGLSRWHKTRAARSAVRRVEYLQQRARRDVDTLVKKRHADLLEARDRFLALESTLALAEENLRARTRAFEEGMATSLEVVDARLTLAGVRLERLLAAYGYDVALAELLEACGQSDRFETYRASADVEVES